MFNKKPNNFQKSQKPNPMSNKNKILENINNLFNPKSQALKANQNNNLIPNPFNIGNNKIKNNNYNKIQMKNIMYTNNPQNEEDSLKLNVNSNNINNEIIKQKGSFGNKNSSTNNMEMGQSPIFENEGNSAFIGQNSNDYKLIELLDNQKSSIDKQEQKKNNNNNINAIFNTNENIFSPPNFNNNNENIINSGFNPINVKMINNNIKNNQIVSNFNIKETNKKSISEDVRAQVENLNLAEMNPSWFQDESNYKDPLYFEKLKKFEFIRMGIKPLQLSDFNSFVR